LTACACDANVTHLAANPLVDKCVIELRPCSAWTPCVLAFVSDGRICTAINSSDEGGVAVYRPQQDTCKLVQVGDPLIIRKEKNKDRPLPLAMAAVADAVFICYPDVIQWYKVNTDDWDEEIVASKEAAAIGVAIKA
jgi:hypothetical protein